MKIQKSDSKISSLLKDIRIAVLTLGTAILFFACGKNNLEEIKAFSSPEELPILEAENFETLYTDSGTIRFFLKTPQLLVFENDGKTYREFPKGVQFVQYDEEQNITSTITADYAKQFLKEGKLEAKNNVVVTNLKGDTLKTELLIWEEKAEKIYTDEFVKVISNNRVINGYGLTSDQNMQNWTIRKVTGTILVDVNNNKTEQGEQTEITEKPSVKNTNTIQPAQGTLKFEK